MIERHEDPDANLPLPALHAVPPPLPHPQGSQGWWWFEIPLSPLKIGISGSHVWFDQIGFVWVFHLGFLK